MVILSARSVVLAQRMTEAEERQRYQVLLEYARSGDVPSRHTAHEEMVKFGKWVEADILGRLAHASVGERQLFWTVLHDRACREATAPALAMLPEAIERCRQGQIAAHDVADLRQKQNKARREGNTALVDQLEGQIGAARGKVPWNEIVQGDEVAVLCAIEADFGREDALRKLVDIAIESSMDDSLAKGREARHTRTHRDKTLPGGTEMWNTVYNCVWEALLKLSSRALDAKALAAAGAKLSKHFETLEKGTLGPNQEAAVKQFHAVKDVLLKTEKNTGKEGEEKEKEEGVGIIKM
jgi:hypothetical protein